MLSALILSMDLFSWYHFPAGGVAVFVEIRRMKSLDRFEVERLN
jgi:predicted phosphoadenosine phosphosulfate sulfurtransferase